MKKILVLTDFSKKAENAALYALRLAQHFTADLILYHSFEKVRALNVPESGAWLYEDFTTMQEENMDELKNLQLDLQQHLEPGNYVPKIGILDEAGYNLGLNVKQLAVNENIDLIVTGSKSGNTLSHLINGSDTDNVMDDAPCPVIFVPQNFRYHQLKTIVFANDLIADYKDATRFLTRLANEEGAQIIITHFTDKNDMVADSYLAKTKEHINYSKLSVITFPRKNIARQLNEFAEDVNASLIAMVHHKHYLMEELLIGSKSKSILKDNNIPVLVFPG
ncbi:universal stress protein [Mucilaginibacter sp.]|uniref:universal stress protein n=1 Tax=Mucilaginibacter sp. TaxID=1882438 RepID=UPI0028491EAE|nr:universal stress protein [Mucilaginibacter sp.]MDR3697506.1 universal stress protein [Mucilaginibacter sp.]